MEENLLKFIITIVTAGITAFITYTVSIKTSLRNKELDLKREQAFKYFLPLKFIADELFHRLSHIEKKIHEKQDINLQLPHSFQGKDFKWFFTDWIDYREPSKGAGGYFLVTAIFMHAQLYYRINLLLKEYPFLQVQLDQSISEYMETSQGMEIKRYYNEIIEQRIKFSPLHTFYSEIIDDSFHVDDNKLIKMKALMICLLAFRNAELV